ncbi:cytochrome P450 [Nocardia mangyaensis]|uniref:cytochrome P450 n=1 Tax=Nocardia mangyaensis TaxID=2213200 RepID=UPI00142FB3A8|nr:cytochrome P450 [Nocardia mangyaensis]
MMIGARKDIDDILADLSSQDGRGRRSSSYEILRGHGSATYTSEGELIVTSYRLASKLLLDHRMTQISEPSKYPDWREHRSLRLIHGNMLTANPPEHTRLRAAVAKVFAPRNITAFESEIERITEELIETIVTNSASINVADDFALPLSITVIGNLLGIPASDRLELRSHVITLAGIFNIAGQRDDAALASADRSAEALSDYLTRLVMKRRAEPRDDLISELVAAHASVDLSMAEIVSMVLLLYSNGFETTANTLAEGIMALLNHPDQADLIRFNPDLTRNAVDEVIRLHPPVEAVSRVAAGAIQTDVGQLPAGQRVLVLLEAVNRDPHVFADPDQFDITRTGPRSLSFGGGIHYCLGSHLAKLEAKVAFPALLRELDAVRR